MITASNLIDKTVPLKKCVLLMDTNPERRALRKKIMALHGVEMIGAGDLEEAAQVWHRDRYDMVLIDIRRDHHGALAFRDEIKKDRPDQIVAFLVGRPDFVALQPSLGSYVPEEHGTEWGESLRNAVRESCESLPQRNGFVEACWRIAATKTRKRPQEQTNSVEEALSPSSELVLEEIAG
jgi:DNA-binding NarL/FixJ family response regulator